MMSYVDIVRRKVRNAFVRYRRMSPIRFAADLRRARRLQRGGSTPRLAVAHAERIVVSLTCIPQRIAYLRPVLNGLLDQTCPPDRIVLAWPEVSIRTGAAYPAPSSLPDGVDVVRCPDQGPATKLLATLREEPSAAIIVVDDDVVYPVDFIETLLAAHRQDTRAALGYRGWKLVAGRAPHELDHVFATALDKPEDVDILLGTWGYLVPPGAFDDAVHDFDGWPQDVRWVDDVWFSGHLARRGIPRRVVPARGLPLETRASNLAALTFGLNRSGRHDSVAIKAFAQWW